MTHRVVWFDVPVADLDRAMKFYRTVLAIEITEDFHGMRVGVMQHSDGEVSGCLVQHEDRPSADGLLLYFNVDGRLDEALTLVEPSAGKILTAKHSIGPWGSRAIVLDSEGNRIALHSS